jgi:hypothetical protein
LSDLLPITGCSVLQARSASEWIELWRIHSLALRACIVPLERSLAGSIHLFIASLFIASLFIGVRRFRRTVIVHYGLVPVFFKFTAAGDPNLTMF